MMKRFLCMLFAVLMGLSCLSFIGCNSEPEFTEDGKKIIRFAFNSWDVSNRVWERVINKANEILDEQGEKIEIQGVKIAGSGWNDYYMKMQTQIGTGRGPDIGEIAESYMPQCIMNGMALEITDLVDRDLNMDDYYELAFNGAMRDGDKLYGMPSSLHVLLMYYNKDMFTEKGLEMPSRDWNDAMSFTELRETAKALTSSDTGANKVFGFQGAPYMGYIGMYAKSNGGHNVFDDAGNCTLTEPESLEVYKLFDDMYFTDKSIPLPGDNEILSAFERFEAGKIAMMVEGTCSLPDINEIDSFNVGVAAVPAGKGTAYTSEFLNSFVIWKGTDNVENSWKALKAIYSEECWNIMVEENFCGLPVCKATLENYSDAFLGNTMDADDNKCLTDALEHLLNVPYNAFYQKADDEANQAMDKWLLQTKKDDGSIYTYADYAEEVKQIVLSAKAESEE